MKNASEKYEEKYKVLDVQYTAYESTEVLKRRMIPYKKLVIPVRMRSVYWQYFGFPAAEDGSIITKDKIVCTLCKNQMIYNRNTSNLRMHLTSRHKSTMAKIDPTALIPPPKSSKPKRARPAARSGDDDFEFGGMGVMGIPKKNETKEVQLIVSEEGNEQDISNIAIIFPNDVVGEYSQTKDCEEAVESNELTDAIVNFLITGTEVVTNLQILPPKTMAPVVDTSYDRCRTRIWKTIRPSKKEKMITLFETGSFKKSDLK